MIDSDDKYAFYAAPDSNIYLLDATSPNITYFENNGTTLIGDSTGRYFYYYENELNTYGVSRLRMFQIGYTPSDVTPLYFGLGDMDFDASTPDVYFGVDVYEEALWPISCAITKQNGDKFIKVFISSSDPTSGISMLSDPTLESTVTGGIVAGCVYYKMVPGKIITS